MIRRPWLSVANLYTIPSLLCNTSRTPGDIPLRTKDAQITLDLKQALDLVYDRSYYDRVIYSEPPVPPLSPADATWAAQFAPQPGAAR